MSQPAIVEAALGAATVDAVVRIMWSDDGIIQQVLISGRPTPRPYAGEGNHLTAWAVFGDVVRRQLVGQDLPGARGQMNALVNRVHITAQRNLMPIAERRTRFWDAGTRCRARITASETGGTAVRRTQLGLAIAAYLSCRQYGPLASVWLGAGQAIGGGERQALATLRGHECGLVSPPGMLRTAIFTLLDRRGVLYAKNDGALANLPGVGTWTRNEIVTEIVVRHMTAISLAYPRAYAASNVAAAIDGWLTSLDGGVVWPDDWDDVPDADPDEDLAPENWSTGSSTGVVVQLTTNGLGTRVSGVEIGGRGRTLVRGQGHHMTAHVVLESQVMRALNRVSLDASRNRLTELCDGIATLGTLPPLANGVPTLDADEDPKGLFAAAWESLTASRAALDVAVDPAAVFDSLAEVASAYLCVRNVLPLAAIQKGALALPAGEGPPRALLDGVQDNEEVETSDAIHQAMWKLLYLAAAAEAYEDMDEEARVDFAPGSSAVPRVRLAAIFRAHRVTMQATWPDAYQQCQFGTLSALRAAIDSAGIRIGDDFATVAADAGFVGAGPVRAPLERVVRRTPRVELEGEDAYDNLKRKGVQGAPDEESIARNRPRREKKAKTERK